MIVTCKGIELFYSLMCDGLLKLEDEDSIKIDSIDYMLHDLGCVPKSADEMCVKAHIEVKDHLSFPCVVYHLLSGVVVFRLNINLEEASIETLFSQRFEKNRELVDFKLINSAADFTEQVRQVELLMKTEMQTFNCVRNNLKRTYA